LRDTYFKVQAALGEVVKRTRVEEFHKEEMFGSVEITVPHLGHLDDRPKSRFDFSHNRQRVDDRVNSGRYRDI